MHWPWAARGSGSYRATSFFLNTPRGGSTSPPRRAQPLLLLSRSNPPLRGGVNNSASIAKYFRLELELIQSHMAQKPMLRGEVGCQAKRLYVYRV